MMAFRDQRMSLPSSPQHVNRPWKVSAGFLTPIPPRGLGVLQQEAQFLLLKKKSLE
jgi:hypothetical protein